MLQPLLVRRDGDSYELIAGERRWRAAKRAGLQDVPVIVREADDTASLEQALVENLHRQDLNALEEAAAYQQLVDEFEFTQAKIAKRVGKSRSAIANTLRLLALPMGVQRLVGTGQLSAGHARTILGCEDEDQQVALAQRCVDEQLTVRELEQVLRGDDIADSESSDDSDDAGSSSPDKRKVGETRAPAVLELERLLSEHLDTRVGVTLGAKKGKIVIDYADLNDLERIYRAIAT